MRGWLMIAAIGATSWLSGCGEDCRSTCRHVYDPSECGIVLPGVQPKELINDCVRSCEDAMQSHGEQRFIPADTPASDNTYALQNEAEAAAWIDCVWATAPDEGPSKACEQLDPQLGGICGPI